MTYHIPVPEFARLEWRVQWDGKSYVDMLGIRLLVSHDDDACWIWRMTTLSSLILFENAVLYRGESGGAATEDGARRAAYDAALRLIDAALLDIGGVRL